MGLNGGGSSASADGDTLMFLNSHEARTLEAVAARIIPGDESGGGAREAGAVVYIDRLLAGFRKDLRRGYRVGLRELDVLASQRSGAAFADLSDDAQDDLLRLLLGPEVPGRGPDGSTEPHAPGAGPSVSDDLRRLAAIIREHTIEGFFCDPAYGGNRRMVGWRLVGFPGAHWGYEPAQMDLGYDAGEIPFQTLGDLRALLADREAA
jgi:gluconate 2-dehydrogenase gamma chain